MGNKAVVKREEIIGKYDGDMHVRSPKFDPPWAPELARPSKEDGGSPLSKDAPSIQEMEGEATRRRGALRKVKRGAREDISDVKLSSHRNSKFQGCDALNVRGWERIEDFPLCRNFVGNFAQLVTERGTYLSREYPDWRASALELALDSAPMRRTRGIGVVSLSQLLNRAEGNTVVKFRRGALAVYKGGSYAPIGDSPPGRVLANCAPYSQTQDGLLFCGR